MNVSNAPDTKRMPIWHINVEHSVYDHACKAMETRPDYPEIERLWAAIDERFKFMRYDYVPEVDEDQLYEMDLSELSQEAGIDDESTISHLLTLRGAGMIKAAVFYQEFNSVSVVIAPHMVAKR